MERNDKSVSKSKMFWKYILMGKEMIFVTVGTHEQQFNRLVKSIDELIQKKVITEEVIMQVGSSDYKPRNCQSYKMLTCDEMAQYIRKARIVITHGGPSSFIMAISKGKFPIVVPRVKKYGEHVNDHQMEFCKKFEKEYSNIIVIDDVKKLEDLLANYDGYIENSQLCRLDNNSNFCQAFEELVNGMF